MPPCKKPLSFAPSTAVSPLPNSFDGTPVTATLEPFSVVPAFCAIDYSCASVLTPEGNPTTLTCADFTLDLIFDMDDNSVDGIDDGKISISADSAVYTSMGTVEPGTYVIKIIGTVEGSDPELTEEVEFSFRFDDPCDAPPTITAPVLPPFEYFLGAPGS